MDRIDTARGLPFRVGFTGHSGHLRIEPLPPVEGSNPLNSLPEFIIPPAFPRETPESIKDYIEDKYLLPRLDPDEFSAEKAGRQWDFDWFDNAKVHLDPTMPRSVVVPAWELPFRRSERESVFGKWEPASVQVDVSEVTVDTEDSSALPRITGPAKDFVKGSINNRPFRPGGLDDSQSLGRTFPDAAANGEWVWEVLNGGPAQIIPPSFKEGMELGELKAHSYSWTVCEDQGAPNITSSTKLNSLSVQFDDLFKKAWEEDITELDRDGHVSESEVEVAESNSCELSFPSEAENKMLDVPVGSLGESSLLDDILSDESGVLTSRLDGAIDGGQQPKGAWAASGGIEGIADHFHDLVPDMALNFPFELDAFQKEDSTDLRQFGFAQFIPDIDSPRDEELAPFLEPSAKTVRKYAKNWAESFRYRRLMERKFSMLSSAPIFVHVFC